MLESAYWKIRKPDLGLNTRFFVIHSPMYKNKKFSHKVMVIFLLL